MKNVGCLIVNNFNRPELELVNLFCDLPVANIGDCMNRIGAIDPHIYPMNKTPLLGVAFTVKVPEGDNLMFHKAMDMAKPGDVIMIDAGGDINRAILGELMISYCQSKGIAGVVVDGSVRDAEALREMNFPVYAKGITPNGPYKNGPGEISTPITIGGKVVNPGDIIVGDQDGIVIIKPEDAEELAKQTKQVMEKEISIMDKILNKGTYDRPWVDEKLVEIGCEYR
ncbi:RraA family protein [Oceanobacillus profundus]|uniref:Putative 4-hydroxy-4-methyl-2-oxoglutarate aldolase n=1 Tax=Oceanobacillus profundus TaxID=372463 RepID=A0A417YN29_9BACI|nr:RraA family protein [Oceanobacillus profundus]RHW35097.1 RraA family protein [Oceanobacillus profundus]